MRKLIIALIVIVFAAPAFAAAPGQWEYMGQENAGPTFAMLGIAALDQNTFVGGTLLQTAEAMIVAVKSSDGGNHVYEVLRGSDVEGFPMVIVADAFDENVVLLGGLQMTALRGGIWRSEGAGEQGTWEEVDLSGMMGFGSSVDHLECVTDTFALALASPNQILATYDAGASWTIMPSPVSSADAMLGASSFIDENIGYVTSGWDDSDDAKSIQADDPAEFRQHRVRWLTSPLYRWQWEQKRRDSEKAILDEGIYKTLDGGQTWEALTDHMNWYASRIDMPSEQYGVVITEESYGDHGNERIRYTEDGGYTWMSATMPDSVPDVPFANYIISAINMINNDLGYAAIMYGAGSLPIGGGMFITTDGGRNWDWVDYHDAGTGYMDMDMVGNTYGFAGGTAIARARYLGVDDNTEPVANAGEDQEVTLSDEVTLDGSASVDLEGDTLSFKWTLIAGPDGLIEILYADEHPYGETKAFTPDTPGDYTFQLKVEDGQYSDTDEVLITVNATPTDDDAVDDDADDDVDDDDDTADEDELADDDDEDVSSGACGC